LFLCQQFHAGVLAERGDAAVKQIGFVRKRGTLSGVLQFSANGEAVSVRKRAARAGSQQDSSPHAAPLCCVNVRGKRLYRLYAHHQFLATFPGGRRLADHAQHLHFAFFHIITDVFWGV
jgi:hypothetical protein